MTKNGKVLKTSKRGTTVVPTVVPLSEIVWQKTGIASSRHFPCSVGIVSGSAESANKIRLSSTTCGEDLQKIFKYWQNIKELCQNVKKIKQF